MLTTETHAKKLKHDFNKNNFKTFEPDNYIHGPSNYEKEVKAEYC